MPGVFDYECQSCGVTFEYTVDSLADKDLVLCRCGGSTKRLLSPPSSFTVWAQDYNPTGGKCGGPREYERLLKGNENRVIAIGNESPDAMHKWGQKIQKEAREREDRARRGAIDAMMTDLGDDLYAKP